MPRRTPVPSSEDLVVATAETPPTLKRREVLGILHEMREHARTLAVTFWEIGLKARRIRDERGYVALGYATFDECIEVEVGLSMRQLAKLLSVIHWYGREDAVAIGFERAAALISYGRALAVDPGELVRENAAIAGVPVMEASVRHIKNAATEAHKLRRKRLHSPAAKAAAREEKALVAHVRDSLDAKKLGRGQIVVSHDAVVVRFRLKTVLRHLRKAGR